VCKERLKKKADQVIARRFEPFDSKESAINNKGQSEIGLKGGSGNEEVREQEQARKKAASKPKVFDCLGKSLR